MHDENNYMLTKTTILVNNDTELKQEQKDFVVKAVEEAIRRKEEKNG